MSSFHNLWYLFEPLAYVTNLCWQLISETVQKTFYYHLMMRTSIYFYEDTAYGF